SSTAHTALSLVLCTLDPDLSWETKVECLETSEELLQDSSTYQFVRWRMTSRVFPEEVDLFSLKNICSASQYKLTGGILNEARELQSELQQVWRTFRAEAQESFGDPSYISYLEDALTEFGIFSLFA